MPDPRTIVERELQRVDVPPFTLGTFHARRDRKRRNQRLAAGALGVSIALAGAVIAARVLDTNRERTAGHTVRNGVIAFEGDRGYLYLSAPDGTNLHVAVRNPAERPEECGFDRDHFCTFRGSAWSPDGTQLAFVYGAPSVVTVGDMSLYVMDAASEEVRLVARCPAAPGDATGTCDDGRRLSWSPDGRQLALSSGDDLFLFEPTSGELTKITGCRSCSYDGVARFPAWSPTGDRIAFNAANSIHVVNSDGTGWRTIVNSAGASFDELNGNRPEWSPDGTKLAFWATEGMFVVNADGSDLRLLVDRTPTFTTGGPSWSPDSRRVLYLMTVGGTRDAIQAEIRVVEVAGGNDRVIYRSDCCVHDWRAPIFSPDGAKIAFGLGIEDDFFLYVMDADGGDVRRLEGFDAPAWQALPS
jgi:Tol biopolymer transport system component